MDSENTNSVTVLTGKQDFQQKLQEIEKLGKRHTKILSPVSGGSTFKFDNSDNSGWNELEQLLTHHTFGVTISNAEFVLGDADKNRNPWNRDFYNVLQRCLAKLPNLKNLTLGERFGIMSISFDEPEVVRMKEQHENIDIFLPELSHLESLEFTNFSVTRAAAGPVCVNFKEFFQAILLKYSPQLQKLTMPSQIWKAEYGARLQNLTQLNLDLEPCSPPCLHSIFENLTCRPKLEKVGLQIVVPGISMKQVIEAIQLCPSVKTLTIITCKVNDHVSSDETMSTFLPNVTSLTLENIIHDDKVPPLSFLKCFPGLDNLKIENERAHKRKRQDAWDELHYPNFRIGAEYLGGERMPIWSLFPKMETFVLDGNSYAREMYNQD